MNTDYHNDYKASIDDISWSTRRASNSDKAISSLSVKIQQDFAKHPCTFQFPTISNSSSSNNPLQPPQLISITPEALEHPHHVISTVANPVIPPPQENGNNENIFPTCCSPESGFGSEHQYSPFDALTNLPNPRFGESKDLEMNKNLADGCAQETNRSVSDDKQFLQIVSVKSLAQTQPSKKIQEQGCEASRKPRKRTQNIRVKSAKRLYIRKNKNNKKSLCFDCTPEAPCDDENIEDSFRTCSFSKLELRHHEISFSGLPALSRRRNFVLSEESVKCFVLALLTSECDHVRIKKPTSLSDHCDACSRTNTKQECCQKQFSKSKVMTRSRRIVVGPPSHIGEIESERVITTENVRVVSSNLHSNALNDSGKITTSAITACSSVPTKTEPKPFPSVAVECPKTSSKMEKIKRLKEILRQREKDLEQVRKSYGFIT